MHILVTNDDGVEAPVLPLLAVALRALGEVSVVVPDGERSWISKAVTREHPVTVARVERDAVAMSAISGTPADCVQLAVSGLTAPVDLVVSGVNIGRNHGAAFVASSGTIGAAMEGAIAGIPSLAISTGERPGDDYGKWREDARTSALLPAWCVLAETAAVIVADILATEVFRHAPLVSVNLPWEVTPEHERRVTTVAPVRYERLFREVEPGTWQHDRAPLRAVGDLTGTDHEAVADDVVSICPLGLSRVVDLPTNVRAALTRASG